MPDTMIGHQAHAILDCVGWRNRDHPAGNNFFHCRLLRRFAAQGHLPRIVAFRKDADQFALIHHEQRADVFLGHQLDRFEHGRFRSDGPDIGAFGIEYSDCGRILSRA